MILGHERQILYLDEVLRRGRFAHAYLFYGPEGVGKLAVAKAAAQALLCPNFRRGSNSLREAGDGCQECRLISGGQHPEVILLDLEHTLTSEKEKRRDIPIKDIHELRRRFSFAPAERRWRIAIVNQADTMSTEAADAFLKTLEEPGERTLFLLVSSAREFLTPTIISRTVPIAFSLVPDRIIARALGSRLAEKTLEEILTIAAGRPGVALRCVQDPSYLSAERKFIHSLQRVYDDMSHALAFAERVAPDEGLRAKTVQYFIAYLRGRLQAAAGSAEALAVARRIERACDITALMETTNVNPRLALEVMLLPISPI